MEFNYKTVLVIFFVTFLIDTWSSVIYAYVIPTPEIEALKPRGLRVSIPDESGVQLFAFHGNINKNIGSNQVGSISGEVYRSKNGRWTFEDTRTLLRERDVLHYWLYVQANGISHTEQDQSWTMTPKVEPTTNKCIRSVTTIQNGISTCQGQLILDENFDSFNTSLWAREIKIPLDPDYEFCVYHNHEESVKIRNGILRIKPSTLEDSYGKGVTSIGKLQLAGCSSNVLNECSRQAVSYNILPPVISARLTTKLRFNFQYGKIEIRAKFPEGDWLYPEMWLQPRYSNYDERYSNGRIVLGMARGNQHLIKTNEPSNDFSGRLLEFGLQTGSAANTWEEKVTKIRNSGTWTGNYHVYTTVWSTDGFLFQVDGQDVGSLSPGPSGWLPDNGTTLWTGKTNMTPFDQELYITLGVGVGGVRMFPDGTTSAQYVKPWKNLGAKAMLLFWQSKDQWLPSWQGENAGKTTFEVDYIRIWSL